MKQKEKLWSFIALSERMDDVFKREMLKKDLYKWFKAMSSEGKTVTGQTCLNLDMIYSYDRIVSIRMFSDLHVSCRAIY